MGAVLSAIQRMFWAQEMEIAVLGLQGAGKSTFVEVINVRGIEDRNNTGVFKEDMMPTVGFNMHKVQKGKVIIKVWDMGGQEKFRSMWERYCRGVQVIVFIIDAVQSSQFGLASSELSSLLMQPSLASTPLLLLFNKQDDRRAQSVEECMKAINAERVMNREVGYYGISCKNLQNIDKTLSWIIAHAKARKN